MYDAVSEGGKKGEREREREREREYKVCPHYRVVLHIVKIMELYTEQEIRFRK